MGYFLLVGAVSFAVMEKDGLATYKSYIIRAANIIHVNFLPPSINSLCCHLLNLSSYIVV